ncbi:hypothetical protein AVEN_29446-1 [Araneus ventricosus]|uniref:Uncharacterized protein n=1 Tax=Araneus ventricosus TaxID=182803 RepID=A0A4Y2CZR8_ARAVE|nr:hypothetical protein AVEN_29446-1 [Araneus ventricosus]
MNCFCIPNLCLKYVNDLSGHPAYQSSEYNHELSYINISIRRSSLLYNGPVSAKFISLQDRPRPKMKQQHPCRKQTRSKGNGDSPDRKAPTSKFGKIMRVAISRDHYVVSAAHIKQCVMSRFVWLASNCGLLRLNLEGT